MIFFFIWDAGEDSLKKIIEFCDSYSSLKEVKSNIRFQSNVSPETVNFLDVNVQLIINKLKTTLHTKATDAHLYLNANIFLPYQSRDKKYTERTIDTCQKNLLRYK